MRAIFFSHISLPSLPFLPTPKPYHVSPRRHYHHHLLLPPRPLQLPLRRLGVLAVGAGRHVGIVIDADQVYDVGDRDLPVDLCFTRTLPPALTLADGHAALRRAVEEIKANQPQAGSGVIRLEVLVPPSTKALKWLCCQCRASSAFPQFYLSRKLGGDPSFQLDSLNHSLEISGIGAVICVHGSYQTKKGYDLLSRYLSVDSHLIRAYGSIGMKYDEELSSIEEKSDSFYFFIPQIELNEFGGYSLLASTMVWDDSVSHTFDNAVRLFESCFQQINSYDSSASICAEDLWMSYISGQSNLVEIRNAQLVYLNAEILATVDAEAKSMQKGNRLTSDQSLVRFSPKLSFCAKVHLLLHSNETKSLIKDCSNINVAWASLIVEECVRLGLTYFCIAPGSRSSPLAISATGHPLTNCISCYDERSLGFHALGYGRASQKPAIVITSSGTAVSNLLPAVVEASQDFVPLMLLTADRPPELQDAGANQAIDQVNHFGKFVRFFFNLPPPSDQVSARMVLTTVDSAAYFATQAPHGPAHINCAFREPLEGSCQDWTADCLRGLDTWFANVEPYTRYLRMKIVSAFGNYSCSVMEVLEVIQRAKQGLLLVGAIRTEDDMWAVALLAKHLSWPVVADILSGLRLRKVLNSFPELEESFLFIDQMDQILLSNSVRSWICPDVVVQIGSRITSKRIGEFLQSCFPSSYILVDTHPCRHDPSHIVTHRIQSSIAEFAASLCQNHLPKKASRWRAILKVLNSVVLQEIMFQIHSESSLTEPHVAHVIGEALPGDAIIFVGNSMVIRDLDMYGEGWVYRATRKSNLMTYHCPDFLGIKVAGNRGASGIDGLLSTAIGFAVGSNKHVFCLMGDVSFLHDTNGLSLLNQRARRKPITVIVINNHGGAIFSLLPIAETAPPEILNKFFYTSHDISIPKLCAAHGVKHFLVQTKAQLQDALVKSHLEQTDCVVEVENCIDDNAKFHRIISMSSRRAATQALDFLLGAPYSKCEVDSMSVGRIHAMEYMLYRIQLSAPRTSGQFGSSLFHEGFILKLSMHDNSIGFGEVAPIEIHEEDLLDVEEQLRFLFHRMKDSHIDAFPLLKGSFSNWIWRSLGVPPSSIFPSVRCGLEMAILNVLAAQRGSSLSEVLTGYNHLVRDGSTVADDPKRSASIQICALVDCNGTAVEVAHVVSQLVDEGFTTIKLKVARRESPIEDAAVIQKLREIVGYKINIRVDANQKWTYEQAIEFGSCVKSLGLQYIEEPVNSGVDIIKFCEDSGLPVALDETIDNLKGDIIHKLHQFSHPGIVALVIKPSVIGGFENAALIAKWAQMHDKMAVISSAFESSLSLSTYVQFAHYIDLQNVVLSKMKSKDSCGAVAYGLGTYQWLREDLSEDKTIFVTRQGDGMEASVEDAHSFLQHFHVKNERIQRIYSEEKLRSYSMKVDGDDLSCLFKLQEAGNDTNEKVVLFLHGFLGTSEDWIPMMKAISPSARAIAVDLPGHGESQVLQHNVENSKREFSITVKSVADLLLKLICSITDGEVLLVGYSMGARIALHMALNHHHKINGAVIISGSPGLRYEASRRRRCAQDKSRAHFLLSYGLECFLETWYSGKIWASLRGHPQFDSIVSKRAKHSDIKALAKALVDSSIGRQKPLWEDLERLKKPLLIIVGEKDQKFKEISQQMCCKIRSTTEGENGGQELCEMFIVPDSGHAVHLENPLPVIRAVRKFLTKLDQR